MGLFRNFIVTMLFFFLLMGVQGFSAEQIPMQGEQTTEAQVADIDNQIEELEALKRGYVAKALRHEDQAERLQFDHETWLEARRHWQLAEENREMAARIQVEIDRLKVRRLEVLRQNGDKQLPAKGGDGFEDM